MATSTTSDDIKEMGGEKETVSATADDIKEMGDEKEIVLLLVGKTGAGKSATGNTLVGRDAFQDSDSRKSCTLYTKDASTRNQDRVLTVVDGPGLKDTRMNSQKDMKSFSHEMTMAIYRCGRGFNALIFVVKYPDRFTEEEKDTMCALKAVFGENVLRDFGIILYTHGELFDMKYMGERSFDQWVEEDESDFKTCVEETSKRVILFRNCLKDGSKGPMVDLFKMVDEINERNGLYTNKHFEKAMETRNLEIVKKEGPIHRKNIQLKINLLIDGVEKVKNCTKLDETTKLNIETLREDIKTLKKEMESLDKGSGILSSLRKQVDSIAQSVDIQEKNLQTEADSAQKEMLCKADEERYEESLRKLKELKQKSDKDVASYLYDVVAGVVGTVTGAIGKAVKTVIDSLRR